LTEAISTACSNLLKYQVHSKRPGSLRFSTDEHPAIREFKELIKEGAEIDIGIPYDLWDRPNVEVMNLKKSVKTAKLFSFFFKLIKFTFI